mmetsp:Transcript_3583/g.12645  ORF Transcript_3583/g.12645 Transcript_3583/m.12645 type:complete len:408 (-) Transcript_3583:313-1536(-)
MGRRVARRRDCDAEPRRAQGGGRQARGGQLQPPRLHRHRGQAPAGGARDHPQPPSREHQGVGDHGRQPADGGEHRPLVQAAEALAGDHSPNRRHARDVLGTDPGGPCAALQRRQEEGRRGEGAGGGRQRHDARLCSQRGAPAWLPEADFQVSLCGLLQSVADPKGRGRQAHEGIHARGVPLDRRRRQRRQHDPGGAHWRRHLWQGGRAGRSLFRLCHPRVPPPQASRHRPRPLQPPPQLGPHPVFDLQERRHLPRPVLVRFLLRLLCHHDLRRLDRDVLQHLLHVGAAALLRDLREGHQREHDQRLPRVLPLHAERHALLLLVALHLDALRHLALVGLLLWLCPAPLQRACALDRPHHRPPLHGQHGQLHCRRHRHSEDHHHHQHLELPRPPRHLGLHRHLHPRVCG